jgi:mono/diheme cytochrome c family protein
VNAKTRIAALAALPLLLSGCSWLTDFRQQPSVGPWQSLTVDWSDTTTPSRGAPQGSVPTTGTALASYEVSYRPLIPVIDSLASVPNPVAVTQASIDRGWKQYQINCAVCHGEAGAGNGPALRFGVGAPSLLTPITQGRTDGYIWGMLRNGRGLMPSMNRIEEEDRWHVVNYVRGLQGRLAAEIVVRKEAAGRPGETGEALPGATRMGPNTSIPFVKPVYVPSPGTGAAGGHDSHEPHTTGEGL